MSAHRTQRRAFDPPASDVARRRLAALTAELAVARGAEAGADPHVVAGEHAAPDDDPDVGPITRPVPVLARLWGWAADRLPVGLQGRAHLGSAQIGVVCLVVAVGLVLGAVWLVRADGDEGEVVPPRAVAGPGGTASPAGPSPDASPRGSSGASPGSQPVTSTAGPPTASSSPTGEVVVDVVGKVRHPGIAVLPTGSRVADAVAAAGGLRQGVDRKLVNLARVLVDGEQIVVGAPQQPAGMPAAESAPTGPAPASGSGLVNLNTADQAALESLPGVGPVTAAAILQWREGNGAFTAVEELLEVDGIGDKTLARIAPHVTL